MRQNNIVGIKYQTIIRMRFIKILVLFFLPIILCFNPIQAGIFDESIGGRSAALGYTSISLFDFWSAINNQAGLASIKKLNVGVYVENKFLLASLNTKSIAITKPVSNGTIGLSFTQFGETAYNETMIGLSYGIKLSKDFSAGIQIFHFAINQANEIGLAEIFSFQGGFIYEPEDRTQIAFHIFNPGITSSSNDKNGKIDLAEITKLGLSYELSEAIQVFLEVQNHSKLGKGFNSGIEYHNPDNLAFRIGYASMNEKLTFGVGFRIKNLVFDLASSVHGILGYSPQVSLIYEF